MYKKAWFTCKVVVLPILKPIAFSRSSFLELSNIQEWRQELVSAPNPLSQQCRQDVRCSEQLAPPQAIAVHTDYTVAAGLIGWEVGQYSYVALYRWWPVHLVVRLLSHNSSSIWSLDNICRPSTKNQSECFILLANIGPSQFAHRCIHVCKIVACESIRFSSALVSPAEKNGGREATTGNTSAVRRLVKLFHEVFNFELHVVQWGKL